MFAVPVGDIGVVLYVLAGVLAAGRAVFNQAAFPVPAFPVGYA
jgi:hypothetical protein